MKENPDGERISLGGSNPSFGTKLFVKECYQTNKKVPPRRNFFRHYAGLILNPHFIERTVNKYQADD